MTPDFKKWPRLFLDAGLSAGADVPLSPDQTHYFKTVMRRKDGDSVRVFNGRDGEWASTFHAIGKRDGALHVADLLIPQTPAPAPAHLFFAPIKKARMDMMIEKAVELGVTDLHPVLTRNTEVRDVNDERLRAQIIEASEQCERMDIPTLHPLIALDRVPGAWSHDTPIFAALERQGDTPDLQNLLSNRSSFALLIGPEGGFTAEEATILRKTTPFAPVSLGSSILRSETAALYGLSLWRGRAAL